MAQGLDQGPGVGVLRSFLLAKAPIVGVFGQRAGWSSSASDPVLSLALKKAGKQGSGWPDLLSREPLAGAFYEWLGERFARRVPSNALTSIAEAPLSAVFTSSIDPGLANMFAGEGREPELVLLVSRLRNSWS